MTRRERAILRHLAHHSAKETAVAFRVSERQVRRILRGAMDRLGVQTEYEAFRWAERPPRRTSVTPEPLWREVA